MKKWPPITIIIVTLNSQRTLKACLNLIKNQSYTNIKEVLIVDGGSKDKTISIAKETKLPVKIIYGGYKNNQEARRAVGVTRAKTELCAFVDSDNFIENKNWFERMVEPLMENKDVVASQTLRYAAPRKAGILNRYFGLIGASDPVAYYLGKDDRLSWAFDKWNLRGKVVKNKRNYFIVDFKPDNYPTVGCNGVVFKKSLLIKSEWGDPKNYIHTDVFVDISRLGYTKFAIVKNEIFHNTAENLWTFFSKRRRYMKIYHQKLNKRRRHLTFDPNNFNDVFRISLFLIYSLTIVEPLFESIRGYLKKRDTAWFLHPLVCFGIMLIYTETTIEKALSSR